MKNENPEKETLRVLLIWEPRPEEVEYYLIEDPDPYVLSEIRRSAGCYINTDSENESILVVADMLETKKKNCQRQNKYSCCIHRFRIIDSEIVGPIHLIVRCGADLS